MPPEPGSDEPSTGATDPRHDPSPHGEYPLVPDPAPGSASVGEGWPGPTGAAPDPGGWTAPVEDPLFGPMPTYATGAYPLAGQEAGGYPIGGHPAGEQATDRTPPFGHPFAAATGPTGTAAPTGAIGAGGTAGADTTTTGSAWAGTSTADSTGSGPAGSPSTGPSTGPWADGYSFRVRAATSPLPVLTKPAEALPTRSPADLAPGEAHRDGPGGHQDGRAGDRPARHAGGPEIGAAHDDPYPEDEPVPGRFAALQAKRFQLPDDNDEPAAGGGRSIRPRGILAVAVGVILVVLAAAAVITAARGGGEGGSTADGPRPAAPSVDPNFVNSARSDSIAVRPNEFFADERVTIQGHNYTRIASSLVTGCPDLSGELVTALKGDVCRQLVRALYVSSPAAGQPQVLAGVSVFVVDEQATATAAAKIAADGRGGVTSPPIPAGSIQNPRILGPAGDNSWRAAIARGHYMILTQLAYVDGSQGAAQDPALRNMITDLGLIATEPIAQRMLVGATGTTPSPASRAR